MPAPLSALHHCMTPSNTKNCAHVYFYCAKCLTGQIFRSHESHREEKQLSQKDDIRFANSKKIMSIYVENECLYPLEWLFSICTMQDPSSSLLKPIRELVFGGWLSSSGECQQVTP